MPLVKRAVEPSALCRQSLPRNVKSELECVTNNTLSGVIKQLSSLSIHAEDLFGELFTEASTFYTRASKLQDRIDKLSVKVTQLDSSIEEVSLHDINMRKAFRSNRITDQQVVSRESLSQTLHATYNKADKPPPLQDLNQFRDDGRDALKIYTDPDYFFNLWREAMQKEMRDAKEKRREQRKKEKKTNPVRKQGEVRKAIPKSRLKAQQMQQGVEFINTPVRNHVDPTPVKSVQSNTSSPSMSSTKSPDMSVSPDGYGSPQVHHPSPPPPPKMADGPTQHYVSPMTDLPAPPPPPPPDMNGGFPDYPTTMSVSPPPDVGHIPPPPPVTNVPAPPSAPNIPAPPPPPPVNAAPSPPPDPNQGGFANALANATLRKTEDKPAPAGDNRGGLLSAIRVGINLKKVEQREKTAAAATSSGGNDVASILARRIAVEFSDSESDAGSDDDEWD